MSGTSFDTMEKLARRIRQALKEKQNMGKSTPTAPPPSPWESDDHQLSSPSFEDARGESFISIDALKSAIGELSANDKESSTGGNAKQMTRPQEKERLPLRQRKRPGRNRERFRTLQEEMRKHIISIAGEDCCSPYGHGTFIPCEK